jgi:Ca2+-binding RTX toxin-like protein
MASFNASAKIDMRTIGNDLAVLDHPDTNWTNTAASFDANGEFGIKVHGTGSFVYSAPTGWQGNVGSLSVSHGGPTLYTIFGTPLDSLSDIIDDVNDHGGQFALSALLSGGDLVNGSDLADYLLGYGGNDTLHGGGGKDRMDGGEGNDIVDYSDRSKAVSVKLAGSSFADVKVGGVTVDMIANIETVRGGVAADRLTGDKLVNTFHGNEGVDRLAGGGGNDHLYGGEGNDRLTGGKGEDNFHFNETLGTKNNVDTIIDFSSADNLVFHTNTFGIGFKFAFDGEADDGAAHVIYRPGTGDLLFDPDGTGSDKPILLAHLEGRPALSFANVATWYDA